MTATESVVQTAISERAAKLHHGVIAIGSLAFSYDVDPDRLTMLNLNA